MSGVNDLRNRIRARQNQTEQLNGTTQLDSTIQAENISQVEETQFIQTPVQEEEDFEETFYGTQQFHTGNLNIGSETVCTSATDFFGTGTLAFTGSFDAIIEPEATKEEEEVGFEWANMPLVKKFQSLEVNKKMLALSLGLAGFAGLLSVNYLNSIVSPLKHQSRMVKVVVLSKDIPNHTLIKKEHLSVKEVPFAYVPKGAIEYKPNMKLLGKVTLTSMYKGEILNKTRLDFANAKTGLDMMIPEGHRAITIKTNNAHLIKPTNQVDVIASIRDLNPTQRGKIISIPVLQKAKVIAVGQQYSNEGTAKKVSYSTTPNNITLAVPDARVNIMNILEQKGNFKVVIRSPGDTSTLIEKFSVQEIEDALVGSLNGKKAKTISEEKPEKEPIAKKVSLEEDDLKLTKEEEELLVDLSEPAPVKQVRRAPVRRRAVVKNYSRPAYRAPAYQPPKPAYRPPAPPAYRPPAPVYRAPVQQAPRTVTVINGGSMSQVNGGFGGPGF